MVRVALLGFACIIGGIADRPRSVESLAWPLTVRVVGIADKPTAFRAYSRGAELILPTGYAYSPNHPLDPPVPKIAPLGSRDTLQAVSPASYPLDLSHGSVTFYTSGTDSIRIVVGKKPFGMVRQVSAIGRRLTVRRDADSVVIDAR